MAYTAQEQANLALVRGLFDEVLNPMDAAAVDRFIAPGYIQHNPNVETGRAPLKAFLDQIRALNPQGVHDVKRMFADGDHVIVHYHVRRWPDDTGWAVIDIFRIENGLIAEHWDVAQDVIVGGPNVNGMF
jgi:predicted SnoaL-like aldol condensation-catalyzing enzyme